MAGPWGALEADNGVLVSSDGRTRSLPAPVRRDETTISGDGWTLRLACGWMVRDALEITIPCAAMLWRRVRPRR